MTNEEQQAEEIRLKLEALHRKILMDFADEIRQECFSNLLHCQWSEYEESFGEMFDAVMLQKAEAAIMGKEAK